MKLSNTQHNQVVLYDTTLRDGAQRKGISFSLEDKLKITKLLDDFGVSYIEGGWPGSNPKDFEYFQRVKSMRLKHARVVAFGSTRKAGVTAAEDQNTARLLEAGTDCVALVGKSSSKHVLKVLRTTLEENLEMIKDSISYLKSHGKEVIFDAEHYFDGFEEDQEYSLKALLAAQEAGADWLVLCDTNGRHIPSRIREIVAQTNAVVSVPLGIHAHNDGELAVANSIAAVEAGAKQIQGTINGYGERCGNANLISLAPTLQLKMGYQCVPQKSLVRLTELSRTVSEIANLSPDPYAPYVGSAAFAHKAGLHAAAVEKFA
ncbi:citramalate synthase, partial [Candidatus Obscuribacterales bacterium]|nr:citramalate synthase [Candidatus Obscuribacterales bacterium]